MAQNFKQIKLAGLGTGINDIPDGANFPTGFHFVKTISLANIVANAITVSVFLVSGNTDNDPAGETKFHLVKDMTIPSGSSFTYDSGLNVLAGDRLFFETDTSASLDVIVSYVQEISD
jgi:hypothetical protein